MELEGVTLNSNPGVSSNTGTDDSGDNSVWGELFGSAGGILTGVSNVIRAVNGTPQYVLPTTTTGLPLTANNTWLYIAGFGLLILVLFMAMRK